MSGRALPDMQGEFAVATYPRLRFLAKPVPARALAETLKELLAGMP